MARVIFVLAQKDFRDEELLHPKQVFEAAGVECKVASTTRECTGMLGARVTADMLLSEVKEKDFNAIVFVGGGGSSIYWNDKTAHSLVNAFYKAGKPTCSICLATGTLANAGVVRGRKVTGWPDTRPLVEKSGGTYTGADVEVDGLLITGKGPHAARAFGKRILEKLG
ncbi:DJ-1/PfpI family protein [Candidatus Micrarchaeota archaeon]|nr:DJ-1/PfpI family protein [Candidatus Micrarchaeota archaeon]